MPAPDGFEWTIRKNGDVVITHHGAPATTLRGRDAVKFLSAIETQDPQQVAARVTGNYKRGNERQGARHPRNQ